MTFDPFGDAATHGYLRNVARTHNSDVIKRLERDAFRSEVGRVLEVLAGRKALTYQDVLDTHGRLFREVYPTWAGLDRSMTAPDMAIAKGGRSDLFAHPRDVRRAAEHALSEGQDRAFMRANPGTVFGSLAYAHPFLEGNGRTILTIHADLCRRAGIRIDWRRADERGFLEALTAELDRPGTAMNAYLNPFVRSRG